MPAHTARTVAWRVAFKGTYATMLRDRRRRATDIVRHYTMT